MVLQPLNLPVSGRIPLPKTKGQKSTSQNGYLNEPPDPVYSFMKDPFAGISDEKARQIAQGIANSQFLAFQQNANNDERILAQRLEDSWNNKFNVVPLTEREPQYRGSEATAYLRDKLQKRLTTTARE